MNLIRELISQIKLVFSSKTIDTIIPPTIYFILINSFTLEIAISISLFSAFFIYYLRYFKDEISRYAIFGLIGVVIAASFTYISKNATYYFLPDIISSIFFLIVNVVSLVINKPFAALLSHITRGWPIDWYWRKDIKPAYIEVTFLWSLTLALRTGVEIYIFLNSGINEMFLAKFILGMPALIVVLIITYVYGIWRLHTLEGPGVDEYIKNESPPWKGQKKGF
ncbi:MAG: DUF3159 domain-containing protein [Bacillota bacterium]